MIERHGDLKGFFCDRLTASLGDHGVQVSDSTEFYLVNLLSVHASSPSPTFDGSFAERLAEALNEGTGSQLQLFRDLGDNTLCTLGFFSAAVERRGLSPQYVESIGERAYSAASTLSRRGARREATELADVFEELSDRFDELATVLSDVREQTSLRTPQDIVRLYERWRQTGSTRLAKRLNEEGVFPNRGGRSVH